MLASAVRTYLNRYAVAAGTRVVVATTNDSAYALAADLARRRRRGRGRRRRPARSSPKRPPRAAEAGIEVLTGSAVADTTGEERLAASPSGASTTTATHLGRRPRSPATCSPSPAAGARSCTCTASGRASCAGTTTLAAFVPASVVETSRSSAPPAAASTSTAAWPTALRPGPPRPSRAGFVTEGGAHAAVRSPAATRSRPARPAAVAGPRPGRRPGRTGPPLRRPAARPDRRRRAAGHRRRHAQRRAHQALHLHQHRQRPGQDLRR